MQRQWMKDLRERSPRVHCITNYVTAGDVANMVLAAGGSPVMAQGLHEVEDVTSICSSLVLNLGTLEERTIPAMEAAGRKAAGLGLPVILDPVGVTEAEIRALNQELRGHETGNTCGVDSETFGTIESRMETACSLRDLTGAVVVMTGVEDVVAGKEKKFIVRNGHPWMARITGSGCMLDGLMGAFCGLYGEPGLAGLTEEAAVTALSAHGLCGELAAAETAKRGGGTGTFRMYLLDKMSLLDDGTLERGKKIEIR